MHRTLDSIRTFSVVYYPQQYCYILGHSHRDHGQIIPTSENLQSMAPAHTSDATFSKYTGDTAGMRIQTVYDIMASLEAAKRTGNTHKYDYFLKLSQDINNWHLRKR